MSQEPDEKILYKEESYAIQGAFFEVYRAIGVRVPGGSLRSLAKEFTRKGIPLYRAQVELIISYKGERLVQTYRTGLRLL